VVKSGTWHIELDDGTGAQRDKEIDGAARLHVGDILPGKLYGRHWRIVRVDADAKIAVAVPDD
jgi:hypothetical protein